MKQVITLLFFYIIFLPLNAHTFEWCVIGAGPSGIAAIGSLLDNNIHGSKILWIDNKFNVGRIGEFYHYVPSNTTVRRFISYLKSFHSFTRDLQGSSSKLYTYDPLSNCPLGTIVPPIKIITQDLRTKVVSEKSCVTHAQQHNKQWHIQTDHAKGYIANNIILATGSKPKKLNIPNIQEISLDDALNPNKLKYLVTKADIVGVFGSSHSAILMLKILSLLPVKKIINFYKHPLKYRRYNNGKPLYSYSGLRSQTASWAKAILEKKCPENLIRVKNTHENINTYLPECTKVIYAIGYEPNNLGFIKGINPYEYDDKTGVISHNLFGIGIAFPEGYLDQAGSYEYKVGLASFVAFAYRKVPQWIKISKNTYHKA